VLLAGLAVGSQIARRADDASTRLGELEANLTERSHRLMSAISEA
jgi:hypothetical protein